MTAPCAQCSYYLIRYQAELSASSSISTTQNSAVGIQILLTCYYRMPVVTGNGLGGGHQGRIRRKGPREGRADSLKTAFVYSTGSLSHGCVCGVQPLR